MTTPTPANAFTIGDADWKRVLSLIERGWDDGHIMRLTGVKLPIIRAIRKDRESLEESHDRA